MTWLGKVLWGWFSGWMDWGFASGDHYAVLTVVFALFVGAAIEWFPRETELSQCPPRVRAGIAVFIGALWFLPLIVIALTPLLAVGAGFGAVLLTWMRGHGAARRAASAYVQRKQDTHQWLAPPTPPDEWGTPTPESISSANQLIDHGSEDGHHGRYC